jgi:hypothetical protein
VMKKMVVGLAFFALTVTSALGQSEKVRMRETLRGLPGVHVVIEELGADIKKDGLTEEQLQTDVEVRLRRAGIRVLTLDEVKNSSIKPALVITITALKSDVLSKLLEGNIYCFSVSIELKQVASLARMPSNVFLVTTWNDGAVGFATAKNVRTIRDGLGDYVDKFANEFLTVNPK